MWRFKRKNDELNILEEIMTEYLQFHGKKDQKWHDTLAALQAIDNKDIMDSERVDKWLKKSGASNQIIDYIKFNKP